LNGVMGLFCVVSANSGIFRAHCVKVHVRYLIYWWVLVIIVRYAIQITFVNRSTKRYYISIIIILHFEIGLLSFNNHQCWLQHCKASIQSDRQIERRLVIFRRAYVLRQSFYCESTRTTGHLILGVLAKFSGVHYSRTPVNGSPVMRISKLDRKCGALPVVASFVAVEQQIILVKTRSEPV